MVQLINLKLVKTLITYFKMYVLFPDGTEMLCYNVKILFSSFKFINILILNL